MVWSTKTKGLAITDKTPHKSTNPVLKGRAPAITTIHFSPLDLFGAAARCSHLNIINPSVVTSESAAVAALVERHVDDVRPDFAILAAANNLKDYVKSYFAGTVASGLAYLFMVRDGYVWSDHFENVVGGNPATGKSPDFIFASPSAGVALVESKGSRAATLTSFDARVKDGYELQVEPHLGFTVGGATASHGYCVGAHLKSTSKAELRIHHTAVTALASPPSAPNNLGSIQRNSYATAFQLSHSEGLARLVRTGERATEIPFLRFEWQHMTWLTSIADESWNRYFRHMESLFPPDYPASWGFSYRQAPRVFFAVEESMALRALREFMTSGMSEQLASELTPLPRDLVQSLASNSGETGGTVFPDGLGVFSQRAKRDQIETKIWTPEHGGSYMR
jgi:hypothetical protein